MPRGGRSSRRSTSSSRSRSSSRSSSSGGRDVGSPHEMQCPKTSFESNDEIDKEHMEDVELFGFWIDCVLS